MKKYLKWQESSIQIYREMAFLIYSLALNRNHAAVLLE